MKTNTNQNFIIMQTLKKLFKLIADAKWKDIIYHWCSALQMIVITLVFILYNYIIGFWGLLLIFLCSIFLKDLWKEYGIKIIRRLYKLLEDKENNTLKN